MHILNLLLGLKAHKEKEIIILRHEYVKYQSQFFDPNNMYDLITQSDQQRAILAGKYDDYIQENKETLLNYNKSIP